jgi:hypothetical protein
MDDRILSGIVKLFDLLLFLLPQWMGINYENLKHGKIKGYKIAELSTFLPQHFL